MQEDITEIARKNLEDRVGRIAAKTIARATAKYVATQTARQRARKKKGDQTDLLIGLVENIYSIVTEQSDKRSWRTLPGRIYLGRVSLPAGEWDVDVRYITPTGGIAETRHFQGIKINNRKKRFLISQSAH